MLFGISEPSNSIPLAYASKVMPNQTGPGTGEDEGRWLNPATWLVSAQSVFFSTEVPVKPMTKVVIGPRLERAKPHGQKYVRFNSTFESAMILTRSTNFE